MLTVQEVADYLRVRPATVRGWLKAGVLPGVNLGMALHRDPQHSAGWRLPGDVLDRIDATAEANTIGI
jgi:excisionase family DNA binding protein